MKLSNTWIWILSIVLTITAIFVIYNEWKSLIPGHYHKDPKGRYDEHIIHNQEELNEFLSGWEGIDSNYVIPTGFFIQSVAFETPNDINFNGYVWQKNAYKIHDSIEMGVDFAEQVNSSSTYFEPMYFSEEFGTEKSYDLHGWYFDVTVRQIFDYSNYPFDYINAWIRVWPKDFNNDDKIVLIPDFESYGDTNKAIFGIDRDIVVGELIIDETFYSYHENTYNTNFGYAADDTVETYKEFYFNLGLKRNVTDAIIINLIPLFVVALLLFAQMMTVTNKKSLIGKFGFSTSGAIATCSALFFIVLLAHIQVRTQFLNSPMVYIEYFYLAMYVTILLVALNAYMFSTGNFKYFDVIHYRDNLIPKLIYWPALMWSLALITMIKLNH